MSDHLLIEGTAFYDNVVRCDPGIFTLSSTSNFYHLNNVSRGTNFFSRVGDTYKCSRVRIVGYFHTTASTGIVYQYGLVVRNMNQMSASVPSLSDVFSDGLAHRQQSTNTIGLFYILHDAIVAPQEPSANIAVPFVVDFPLNFIVSHGTSSTGALDNIIDNALFFFCLGTVVSTGASVIPTVSFSWQLLFQP